MGIGMGFVMSPMSTAAMNAVDRAKAGVASGILSMNRMVGGTFGVAVARRAGRHARPLEDRPAAPPATGRRAHAPGWRPRLRRRAAGVPARVVDAAQQAFVYALHYGLLLGSAVALLGAARRVHADQAQPGRYRGREPPRRRAPSRICRATVAEQPPGPARVREPETVGA